jgi:hypothetical protein
MDPFMVLARQYLHMVRDQSLLFMLRDQLLFMLRDHSLHFTLRDQLPQLMAPGPFSLNLLLFLKMLSLPVNLVPRPSICAKLIEL